MPEACAVEQKKSKTSHNLLVLATLAVRDAKIRELINPDDFSSKEHLLRVTALVFKCAKIWKQRAKLSGFINVHNSAWD